MNKYLIKVIPFLALFAVEFCFAAALKLEIIPLQYRTTEQIIPVIRPLIDEGGTVTGMNNQLIIKTSAANLVDIKEIIKNLDKAPRRLMITAKQDIDGSTNTNRNGLSGRYSSGDVTITNSQRRQGRQGAEFAVRDSEGNIISYRTQNTRSSTEDKNDFRVQTIEGEPAFIQTGQSVPVANQNTYITQGGAIIQDTVEYRDVTSGFYVVPNLSGDRVTLFISPQLSRVHPHQGATFEIQNAETTVQGRLGEWIDIGGLNQEISNQSSGILHNTRRRGQESRSILIKVDEIPEN